MTVFTFTRVDIFLTIFPFFFTVFDKSQGDI